MSINHVSISYPDFVLNTVIQPDQFDTNNSEIVNKINEVVDVTNTNNTAMNTAMNTANTALANTALKADKTYVDGLTFIPIGDNMLPRTKFAPDVQSTLNALDVTASYSPTLVYGMNGKIASAGKTDVFPKTTWAGQNHINLRGKDGNCEDVSAWGGGSVSLALDSLYKVRGNYGIKVTLTNSPGYTYPSPAPRRTDLVSKFTGKYLFYSIYIRNFDASTVRGLINLDGINYFTDYVSSTTKFIRVGVKVPATTVTVLNASGVSVVGSVGNSAYMDCEMVNEITSDEYDNLTVQQLLDKYPYVESYACLTNPSVTVVYNNLVSNGNCERGLNGWLPYTVDAVMSVVNNKFRLVTTTGTSCKQSVNVHKNTDYYISASITGSSGRIAVYDANMSTPQLSYSTGGGTFNSGSNDKVFVALENISAGTSDFGYVMLIEGTTAPGSNLPRHGERVVVYGETKSTTYLSQRVRQCVVEGKFTSDDTLVLENGKVSGLMNWKHPAPLYGKTTNWQYASDYALFKRLIIPNFVPQYNATPSSSYANKNLYPVKWDGSIISNVSDTVNLEGLSFGGGTPHLYYNIPDTDSGFAETIIPNQDEVTTIMNGWKAIANNGTRYLCWVSVMDGSAPGGTITTATTSSSASGQAVLNVTAGTGTNFVNGEFVCIRKNDGTTVETYGVLSSTANTVTMSSNLSRTYDTTYTVIKADNGTTTNVLAWCKNNIAPNYPGIEIHFKTVNSEPITDGGNVVLKGSIPTLDNGDNYVMLDSGVVLGGVANQIVDGGNLYAHINDTQFLNNLLKDKVESINSIYRNSIEDTSRWVIDNNLSYTNGKYRAYIPTANFDTSASYTVDYKILSTIAPSVGTIACSYSYDVFGVITDVTDAISNISKYVIKNGSNVSQLINITKPSTETVAGIVELATATETTTGTDNTRAVHPAGLKVELDKKASITQQNWIAPTFLNSWVNYGGATTTLGYYKDTLGIVHLKGMVKSGTIATAICTLPVGYRPISTMTIIIMTNDTSGKLTVGSDGNIICVLGSNTYVSLDNISYKAEN